MFVFRRSSLLPPTCIAAILITASSCGGQREPVPLPPAQRSDAGVEAPDAGTSPAPDAGFTVDAGQTTADLRDRLLSIPGLDVEELFAPLPETRAFALRLRQPEDHFEESGPSFKQRMILVHRSVDAPMVLSTTGYGLFGVPELFTEHLSEPAAALLANQLTVEHRFFGESIAREPRWAYLTVEQSAHDSHRIVELLSEIYGAGWVGTGVSKGGMTAIFHHRYFPEDLAAIVPYVAPISFGQQDPRYLDWLANIGPADGVCRARVRDIAVEAIQRRAELAQYFMATDPVAQVLRPEVVEAVVAVGAFSWHWGFWQSWGSPEACAGLPPRGAAAQSIAAWFPFHGEYAFGWDGFDPEVSPYGYQVENELGGQAIDTRDVSAAAAEVDFSDIPQGGEPPPWGRSPSFDPRPMRAVDAFLREEAQHVLGVYGAWDPWSGGIITVNENNDSVVVVVPEIGHAAQIGRLPPARQDELLARLDGWLGRSNLVAPDRTEARSRIAAHRAHHEWLVDQTRRVEAQLTWARRNVR